MSELDGNININEVLQIVRFGGEGIQFALKGAGKALKVAGKATSALKVKNMQIRLFLHYHSKSMSRSGKLKGLSLHMLEKLTGGDYSVVNLPTEDKESLSKFFKTLKKAKIPYSVLPDLVPGNGFSQIAIDPSRAHRLEAILDVYDFEQDKMLKEPVSEEQRGQVIPIEDYWNEGNPEEKEKITQSAIEQAEKEAVTEGKKGKVVSIEEYRNKNNIEIKKNPEITPKEMKETKEDIQRMMKLEKLKERHQSRDYFPVTIDQRMIVAENEKAYVTRVPQSYDQESGNFLLMTVNKDNALKTNNGQTILTHMRKDGQTYICDRNNENGMMMKNQQLYREHYSEYSTDFDLKKKKVYARTKNIKNQNAKTIHMPRNIKK